MIMSSTIFARPPGQLDSLNPELPCNCDNEWLTDFASLLNAHENSTSDASESVFIADGSGYVIAPSQGPTETMCPVNDKEKGKIGQNDVENHSPPRIFCWRCGGFL